MGGDSSKNEEEEKKKKEEEEKRKKEEEEKREKRRKEFEELTKRIFEEIMKEEIKIKEERRKDEEKKKKEEEEIKKKEDKEEKELEKMRQERRRRREEKRKKQAEEIKRKREYEREKRKENEKKEIAKREDIKKESKQIQQKEQKIIYKRDETNQIYKKNQNVNNSNRSNKIEDNNNQDINNHQFLISDHKKNNLNFKPKKYNNENIKYRQRYVNNYQTNRNIETKKSVILDDKNIIKNIIDNKPKKEKENLDSMKNSDLISDYDKTENKLRISVFPNYNKSNNKNIMINNDEEEIIFDNEDKNENKIDNNMTRRLKRTESFVEYKKNINIVNEDKEIINKNEIIKGPEIKIKDVKNVVTNEIKKNEMIKGPEIKIKEVKNIDRNEIKNNQNNVKNNDQNVNNINEKKKININNNLDDNLNINQILLNKEVENESLNDNYNSNNNSNNLNKNDDQYAFNEFLKDNLNLNINDICNFIDGLENLENNENIINDENEEDISYSPNYFSLLQNINIFNSVLIILNNISFIRDYFSSNIDYIIQKCQFNNAYCLAYITYYMNKYLWKIDDYLNISEYYLLEKYLQYISRYIQFNNINNSISFNYCYEPRNTRNIYKSIFKMINNELTRVNGPNMVNYNNNYNYELSRYLNEIKINYNSILSENLMGFFKYQTNCDYCKIKSQRYGFICKYEYEYKAFYEITFNLREINYYYKNKKISQLAKNNAGFTNNFNYYNKQNNEKQNIYLDQCFNYTFNEANTKSIMAYCDSCRLNTNKSQNNLIYSPPNILPIILTNNEFNETCNFIFQDELNIKKFIINSNHDGVYLLISCLCRLSNTGKYICYCINQKDSYWYSYSDGQINKVEKIDEYAIPLILFYQARNTMYFEYNNITIVNEVNKVNLTVKFNNGIQPKNISFNKESTIKTVIEKILSTINLKGVKGKLSINGERAIEDELLSKYLEENNNVLLIISK